MTRADAWMMVVYSVLQDGMPLGRLLKTVGDVERHVLYAEDETMASLDPQIRGLARSIVSRVERIAPDVPHA